MEDNSTQVCEPEKTQGDSIVESRDIHETSYRDSLFYMKKKSAALLNAIMKIRDDNTGGDSSEAQRLFAMAISYVEIAESLYTKAISRK